MSTTSHRPLRPIVEVAAEAGLEPAEIVPYGPHMAKVPLDALARRGEARGRVVLVTAITPTPAGEGKTVTAVGLAQGLRRLGVRTVLCLRQPSMGPVFGMKGGGTGGGRCTVEPASSINLHFTGDFHAVAAATNLLAAMVDDHLSRERTPRLDVRHITHHRVLDVNDRALRSAVVGLGGGLPREERFEITAASEVMAVLALAADYADLRRRLGRIVVGTSSEGTPVTADDLRAAGAMAVLLREALQPNLVQTQEGGPALVHAGPFGNIAHGTSSLISLRLAQALAEVVVVEAGFGADLGAEKFVHVVGAHGGPQPTTAVVVATVRALRHHGGVPPDRVEQPDVAAVHAGLPQLGHHVRLVRRLGMRPVVCVNRFASDTAAELDAVLAAARALDVPAAVCEAYATGGAGAEALARLVRDATAQGPLQEGGRLYGPEMPLRAKVETVARQVYGAAGVVFAPPAARRLADAERHGFGRLPVCIAKTQYSLTDQPQIRGVPAGFELHVREAAVRAGAGFVLVVAGDISTMPGLPARPRAWEIDLDPDGTVRGIA